jgi:hypothetical protein
MPSYDKTALIPKVQATDSKSGGTKGPLALTDITDPIVFSTIAQTAVLTLTLVIFIMSFRTQNKATKEAAYQKILDDYTDAIRLVLEKPELSKLQIDMAKAINPGSTMASLSADDMTVRNYLVLLYGLFERTHLLYRRKWIDRETWNQWSAFLEAIAKHPMFKDVHRSSEGMYDKPFMDYVSNILNTKSKD